MATVGFTYQDFLVGFLLAILDYRQVHLIFLRIKCFEAFRRLEYLAFGRGRDHDGISSRTVPFDGGYRRRRGARGCGGALGGQHRRLRAVCLRRAGGTASRGHRGGRLLARGRLICAR